MKIKNIIQSDEGKFVVEGKWVFVEIKSPIIPNERLIKKHSGTITYATRRTAGNDYFDSPQYEEKRNNSVYLHPIIISETERVLEDGNCKFYHDRTKSIQEIDRFERSSGYAGYRCKSGEWIYEIELRNKILAEYLVDISTEMEEQICKGEIQNGDVCLLECEDKGGTYSLKLYNLNVISHPMSDEYKDIRSAQEYAISEESKYNDGRRTSRYMAYLEGCKHKEEQAKRTDEDTMLYMLEEYDRMFKLDTFCYKEPCKYTVKDWFENNKHKFQ